MVNCRVLCLLQFASGTIFLLPIRALLVILILVSAWMFAKLGMIGLDRTEIESNTISRKGKSKVKSIEIIFSYLEIPCISYMLMLFICRMAETTYELVSVFRVCTLLCSWLQNQVCRKTSNSTRSSSSCWSSALVIFGGNYIFSKIIGLEIYL